MKFLSSLLLLLTAAVYTSAQTTAEILGYAVYKTKKLDNTPQEGTYYITIPYGESAFSVPKIDELQKQQIISVQLVYTKFSRSQTFNQRKLNIGRIENLRRKLPQAFGTNSIFWELVEQQGATDYKTGTSYFHGFVIKTRKGIAYSAEDREEEIRKLKAMLDGLKSIPAKPDGEKTFRERNMSSSVDRSGVKYYNVPPKFSDDKCELPADAEAHIKYPEEAKIRGIKGRVEAQFTVNRNGDVQDITFMQSLGFGCEDAVKSYLSTMPKWKPAQSGQDPVSSYVSLTFWFALSSKNLPRSENPCDMIVILGGEEEDENTRLSEDNKSVSSVFDRNKDWNNVAVVCDVTGSMGPFIGDMMKWFRTNESRIKHFTFFNDGDTKTQIQKIIGSTGGIYHVSATGYDAVESEVFTAMRNGFGGDLPENDVEALIDAEKNAPFAQRLVWIADNFATPRDIRLLENITKPVSIILCTDMGAINTDYLDIARTLKASLHIDDADITNLHVVEEGKTLSIGKRNFVLQNGKFKRVY